MSASATVAARGLKTRFLIKPFSCIISRCTRRCIMLSCSGDLNKMFYPEHDCMLQCLVQREMKICPNPKIHLQKAPGHDFAQNGRFQFFLCQQFNSQLEPTQMPKSSSKRLLARIWPKMAVSSLSHASGLITIWSLPKCQNPAPKGSWP